MNLHKYLFFYRRKINPDFAVISTFIQGTNYERARIGAATQGVQFPSKATFFRHQKELIPRIERKCNDHLNNTANSVYSEKKFDLSGDGTYPTARDSMQCSYACMDCIANKVINVRSISKKEF